jgi:predicted phage terminase large subunit-like protein
MMSEHEGPRVDIDKAAGELLHRRKARNTLLDYVTYVSPEYKIGKHHRLIAAKLEDLASGKISRLIIEAPPRHGKSFLAAIHFPAWFLGKYPTKQIIVASHSAEYASDIGRSIRNLVGNPETEKIFNGLGLAQDSKAADRWHTTAGGVFVGVGVGSSVLGRGAHLALIDDPLKGHEEADSKLMRERLWSWYQASLYTRLMPGAGICVIATRWSFDDLTGRLLDAQDKNPNADKWEVVHLPAIAEDGDILGRLPGEALWPEWFPIETLKKVREAITIREGPRFWSALYQQRPVEEEGTQFRKSWFKYYGRDIHRQIEATLRNEKASPGYFRVYGASDYAVTSQGGDFTVHMVVGVDQRGDIYVLDLWRGQETSDVWVEAVVDLMEKWKPMMWAEESGQIAKSIGPYLQKRMRERNVYCRREQFSSATDKVSRTRSIAARASMGKVYLPEGDGWTGSFLYELTRFPVGINDDQVDAFSLIGRMLDTMHSGTDPVVQTTTTWEPTTVGEMRDRHFKAAKRGRRVYEAPIVGDGLTFKVDEPIP